MTLGLLASVRRMSKYLIVATGAYVSLEGIERRNFCSDLA
jgi:hypothetical protein